MDRQKAYDILGLHQNAGEDEVKNAYRELAKKYSADQYDAGPLKDDAAAKMAELNQAFDTLMSYLRTGTDAAPPVSDGPAAPGRYPAVRQMINSGRIDEALAELSAAPYGAADAEWNFLMGSAYYYKGWLDQALFYFREAVRLEPGNPEYEAALRNLQGNSQGNMAGSPFGQPSGEAAAMNCACNTCTLMCCMDACCGMCRGF